MIVRDKTFTELCAYVSSECSAVDLGHPAPNLNGSRPRIALTFDDGWSDNAHIAAPIARANGIPLTIFLCSGMMGEVSPFWPERVIAALRAAQGDRRTLENIEKYVATRIDNAGHEGWQSGEGSDRLVELIKRQPGDQIGEIVDTIAAIPSQRNKTGNVDSTMTWAEARALREAGARFGSHTCTHQILPGLKSSAAEKELLESKAEIEQRLSEACSTFSYPNGEWSQDVRDLVAKAGYAIAFTNQRGIWTQDCDPLLIPRINLWEGAVTNPLGWFSPVAFDYVVFWRTWRSHKKQAWRSSELQAPAKLKAAPGESVEITASGKLSLHQVESNKLKSSLQAGR